jgi:hypothetical protein
MTDLKLVDEERLALVARRDRGMRDADTYLALAEAAAERASAHVCSRAHDAARVAARTAFVHLKHYNHHVTSCQDTSAESDTRAVAVYRLALGCFDAIRREADRASGPSRDKPHGTA